MDELKLLMVEDSASLATIYEAYLDGEGYRVVRTETLARAHLVLDSLVPDIVLLDIELPDGDGMDFLAHAMSLPSPPLVVIMTAYGTSDMALRAMELGASDFLTKPFDAARLRVTLANAVEQRQLGRRVRELSATQRDRFCSFIGASTAMQSVYRTLESLAAADATGFIVGESGTGKELAAEAIHNQSPRADREFVAINCGAIPGELMESELFGHVKGAFTGASAQRDGAATVADGGTLFLDEICEMDLELQKKLLRFIQTGSFRKVGSNKLETVDVRFVCATNRDPLLEVQAGRFREDLFYRLHVVPVRLPPLRERDRDVLLIAEALLGDYALSAGKGFKTFSPEAQKLLLRYPWPGNVRQLQNVIQRAVVLNDGERIEAQMLPEEVREGHLLQMEAAAAEPESRATGASKDAAVGYQGLDRRRAIEPLWLVEKRTIEAAIEACDGNINRAAGLLEVAPSTLYRKRQSWLEQI